MHVLYCIEFPSNSPYQPSSVQGQVSTQPGVDLCSPLKQYQRMQRHNIEESSVFGCLREVCVEICFVLMLTAFLRVGASMDLSLV